MIAQHLKSITIILMLAVFLYAGVATGVASEHPERFPMLYTDMLQVGADPVIDVGWNSDNSILAVAKLDSGLYLYNQSMQQIKSIPFSSNGGLIRVEWSPINPELIALIAASYPSSSVEVWNVENSTKVFSVDLLLSEFPDISWSSDGSKLAVVGGFVGEVWDIGTGTQAFQLNRTGNLETDLLYDVEWNAYQSLIATDGVGQETVLWNADNGEIVSVIPQVGYLAWGPDGDELALLDNTLQIYNLSLEQITHTFPIIGAPLSILWKGDALVVTSIVVAGNRFVQIIDSNTFQVIETIELTYTPDVALTSDGAFITMLDNSGNIDFRPTGIGG